MRDLATEVAISEVFHPTLGVTEQVLAVHQIVMQDGKPVILSIDESSEAGAYYVYFQIYKQPYYFVVVIRREDDALIASASYIEAGVRVYLLINSNILNPIEITERIGLTPTKTHAIGEVVHLKLPHRKFKDNRWYFEPQKDVPGNLENKLTFLLEQLEPVQTEIANLRDQCDITISICYKGYRGWMSGWHIDRATICRIEALNAEVSFDLYAYGEYNLPQ